MSKNPDVKIVTDLDTEETVTEKQEPSVEIKEEPVVESKEAQESVVPKEHYENLKKALQEARGKSKAEIESLRRRLQSTESKLEEIKDKKAELDLFEGASDEDAVTVAGAKKMVGETRKLLEEREKKYNEMMGAMIVGVSELLFKREHPDYDEVTQPYRDLLESDPDFMRKMLADGVDKAPSKLYNYAMKEMEKEEVKEPKKAKAGKEPTPIDKPKTMDQRSRSESVNVDKTKLTIEEKRKLTPEELDKSWQDLVK